MDPAIAVGAVVTGLVIGLAIGAVAATLVLRRSHRFAIEAALASAGAQGQVRIASIEARAAARELEYEALGTRLDEASATIARLRDAVMTERVARAQLDTRLSEERRHAEERQAERDRAREDERAELTAHFKSLAGEALEANRQRMAEQQRGDLDLILKPLGEKLAAFEKKVEDTYDKEAQQRFSLQQEVQNLQLATARINQDANNLTRALKGESKTRGNWGEVVLERVLERSGLVRGVEYETQPGLKGDDGEALRPDVVIRLPDAKHIVIDSKVSLVAYDRYYAAVDDDGRTSAGRDHVRAVREHAKQLGAKAYQTREGLDSPDFVAMFVPIEPALGLASSLDSQLFLDAWDAKVVIVTPSTLLAVLTTVRTLWQREKQTRNAIEIAEQSGALHDQFVLVIDALRDLGKQLGDAQKAFEQTEKRLIGGRGNLVGRIDKLRELGARTKRQLPPDLVERATTGEPLVLVPPSDDRRLG